MPLAKVTASTHSHNLFEHNSCLAPRSLCHLRHIIRTVLCISPFALQIAQAMKDYVVPHAQIAAKYGKPLLTYESGPAITAGSGDFPVQVRRTETLSLTAASVFLVYACAYPCSTPPRVNNPLRSDVLTSLFMFISTGPP